MPVPVRTIAVLVANPALGSILGAVLAAVPSFRVRTFETPAALFTYMHIAPVDLVVLDFDAEYAPAGSVACALRDDAGLARRDFEIIALASDILPHRRSRGIDEVIAKPMSPRYLLERVHARLLRLPPTAVSRRRRATPAQWPDFSQYANVVPLFPRERPAPLP